MLEAASADDLRTIIRTVQVGIVIVDAVSHCVLDVNPEALRILERSRREVVGRVCHDFICPASVGDCPVTDRGKSIARAECAAKKPDGSTFPVLKTVAAHTLMGRRCLVEVFLDISGQKAAQAALQRQRDFSEGIIETAQAIILVLDTNGHVVRINPFMERLCGYSQDEVRGMDWFGTFVPKERREDVRGLFRQALEEADTDGNVDYMITRDGRQLEIEWWSRRLKDPDGKVTGLLCIGQDVTDRLLSERRSRDQLAFIQTLLDTIPSPIFYKDTESRYLGCNAAFEEFVGEPREKLIGRSVADIAPPEISATVLEQDRELIESGGTQVYDWKMLRSDGAVREVTFSRATFNDADGNVAGLIGVASDITEMKRHQEMLRERAQGDELTGLLNRRGFMAAAELALERATEAGMEAFVLYADLNEMKRINDELGHQSGDIALKAVARALNASFRTSDVLGRVGGDEFVAMGVVGRAGEAARLPARLREKLRLFQPEGFGFPVTVSVGLVEFNPAEESDLESVLARADDLMYEDKRAHKAGRG